MAKTKTVNLDVTFSMVAKVGDKIDIEDFLRNKTEWLGEPKDASGCIVAMRYKSFEEKVVRVRDDE